MAVSLKALCYAIYVSAAIVCLLSLPWDVILGTAGGAGMFRMLRYITAMKILPYVLVLVLFYKIRENAMEFPRQPFDELRTIFRPLQVRFVLAVGDEPHLDKDRRHVRSF